LQSHNRVSKLHFTKGTLLLPEISVEAKYFPSSWPSPAQDRALGGPKPPCPFHLFQAVGRDHRFARSPELAVTRPYLPLS
jgi:hypothetical protein